MVDVTTTRSTPVGGRPLRAGGVVVLLSSIAVSLLSFGALPARLRLHWTLGAGPYYGPEFAPAAVVLTAFPLLVAALFVGATRLATLLERDDAFDGARSVYEWAVLLALGFVVVFQVGLVVANLG